MRNQAARLATVLDEVVVGTGLGVLVLGGGGRIAMRAVALATDRPLLLSLGGTVTVLASGAAAGAAGGLLRAVSRTVAQRSGGWSTGVRLVLFAALLALVTRRGLHGTPPAQGLAFWPVVFTFGALLEVLLIRRRDRDKVIDGPVLATAAQRQ